MAAATDTIRYHVTGMDCASCAAKIEGAQPFADHHRYTDEEARGLLESAKSRKLMLVTTEKDLVRLKGSPVLDELASASLALPIRLQLPDELIAVVMAKISAALARSCVSRSTRKCPSAFANCCWQT